MCVCWLIGPCCCTRNAHCVVFGGRLLTSHQITFFTITLGPALALIMVLWRIYVQRRDVKLDLMIVLVSNCAAVVPLLCLAANLLKSSFDASFPTDDPARAASILETLRAAEPTIAGQMQTNGNETTIFLALIYAALLIGASIYRNLCVEQNAAEQTPLPVGSDGVTVASPSTDTRQP